MDKEQLSRYYWLCHEIDCQRRRQERLKQRIDTGGLASDVVRGSSAEYPYLERKIKITGAPIGLLKNIQSEIERNIEESLEARKEIEAYIAEVEDPQMRELLRSRFIDRLTWQEVGRKNYVSPDHARKKIREFLASGNER